MRKIILLAFGLLITTIVLSQEYKDVIYLKNGSIIKGEIIKIDLDKEIIIKTIDGQLYSYHNSEIEQIIKEQPLILGEYGGSYSYGVSFGGAGIVGVPIRFHPSEKFTFEMSLNYRPGIFKVSDYWSTETRIEHSFVLGIGGNYYFGKYFKEKRQKVKLNGLALKVGAGTGGFETLFFGAGWIHESFKKYRFNKSFTLELGPGIVYSHYKTYNSSLDEYLLGIYWKVQWNWFKD
jgi:hypothetical protein